jgi:hypothetical protein
LSEQDYREVMDIKAFWHDVISQNKSALPSYFCDDAVIRWHCTNEQFTVSEYIRVNCDYPGKWKGVIERLEEHGNEIILVGNVQSEEGGISCHVVSFIKLRNDKISEMDEYWADDGDAPAWRKELGIGKPI